MTAAKTARAGARPSSTPKGSDAAGDISGWIQRNPYGALAGALGVGFVLGGGIFTRLTARLVGAGLRMGVVAAVPLVREELLQGVTRFMNADVDVEPTPRKGAR